MEGLIPLVYKCLRKTTTQRQYECLSSGATQSYKIQNFYAKDDIDSHYSPAQEEADTISGLRDPHYRRSRSMHVRKGNEDYFIKPKLVRFGSRTLFSCASGA